MINALSVAKELVRLSFAGEEQDPLTNLRLQKLLYYAQAWSLVLRESELFPDEIEAWRWGPVVPVVYKSLPNGHGSNQISNELFAKAPDLSSEEAELVGSVWESYNQYSALQLSRMTHQEMPWKLAWGDRPIDGSGSGNHPIKVDDLEEYFGKQQIPAPLATYSHGLRRREEEAQKKLLSMPRVNAKIASYTPTAKSMNATM